MAVKFDALLSTLRELDAPADAQYLTLAVNPNLSQERTLAVSANLTLSDGGANGNATLDTIQGIQTTDNPTFNQLNLTNQLISTLASGTAPLSVTSDTLVTNLNADQLDGQHATDFALFSHTHDASDVVSGILGVPRGGSGVGSATAYALLAGGTTSTAPFQSLASVGSAGQVLTSNGAGTLPTWQTLTPSPWTDAGTFLYPTAGEDVILGGTTKAGADIILNDDGSATFNEQASDVDFRVEGVGNPNALFVQGSDGFVGVGTGTPSTALDIGSDTGLTLGASGDLQVSVASGDVTLENVTINKSVIFKVNDAGVAKEAMRIDPTYPALLIGTTNPGLSLGTRFIVSNDDQRETDYILKCYTDVGNRPPRMIYERYRGTEASPAACQAGDVLSIFRARGAGTSSPSSAFTAIEIRTTSDGAVGSWIPTKISFFGIASTSSNVLTEHLTIRSSSRVGINQPSPGAMLEINNKNATDIGAIIKAVSGQSANVLEVQSSVGVVGFAIAPNTRDFILDTTTGSKIATATNQKLALWNKTPIVQPTTGGAAATFVANTSGIVDDSATFDGYTLGQVVRALRDIGVLA